MKEYIVIKSRKSEMNNPIILSKGDTVICTEESDKEGDWPNWVYCKKSSLEGWVPKQIIENGIMLEDYNATEFDLERDEIIVSDKVLNGWILGHKKSEPHIKAWAPLNHLSIMNE